MRNKLFVFLVFGLLCVSIAYGQECPDSELKSSGTLRFRQQEESLQIPIQVAGCETVSFELRWANGRSNGSNFLVTFLDNDRQAIHTRAINGYLYGSYQFPFATLDPRPWYGSGSMISVPSTVTIQAVRPFAVPANISYTVIRIGSKAREKPEKVEQGNVLTGKKGRPANEVVSIHSAVRLIGSSRVPLVLIELKTARPFPVRDTALQLQIGKRLFLNELSGDFTGRTLILSLTPEMFAELQDGSEMVAFFGDPQGRDSSGGDKWDFGRLDKKMLSDK